MQTLTASCPMCGAHIQMTALAPQTDSDNLPEDWTPWVSGNNPCVPKHALIDVRFRSGIENYSFKAWSVTWERNGSPTEVEMYRRAVKDHPPHYTTWK